MFYSKGTNNPNLYQNHCILNQLITHDADKKAFVEYQYVSNHHQRIGMTYLLALRIFDNLHPHLSSRSNFVRSDNDSRYSILSGNANFK
jgi:hypothetical protein